LKNGAIASLVLYLDTGWEWSVSRLGRLTPLRNIPRYTFIGGGVGPNVGRVPLSIIILPVVIISVADLKGLFGE